MAAPDILAAPYIRMWQCGQCLDWFREPVAPLGVCGECQRPRDDDDIRFEDTLTGQNAISAYRERDWDR